MNIDKIRNTILHGDAIKELKKLPNKSIDMCITSPPYYALRDYNLKPNIWGGDPKCDHDWDKKKKTLKHHSGETNPGLEGIWKDKGAADDKGSSFCSKCEAWKGCLGLEPTFSFFIDHLCDIFDEVKRVLKEGGTCWVNIGDSYNAGGNYRKDDDSKARGYSYNRAEYGRCQVDTKKQGLPAKCLLQIPARFAIAMCDRGWILRSDIIWKKNNSMPSSVKDRPSMNYEHVFLFVKNKHYYFEQQFEPCKTESVERLDRGVSPLNKWVDGPDGQARHTMNQPRENINRKGRKSNNPELGNRNFMPIKKGKKLSDIPLPNTGFFNKEPYMENNPHRERLQPEWTQQGRNLRAVWEINTKGFPFDYCPKCDTIIKKTEIGEGLVHKACGAKIVGHFAVYPEELIATPIKAGCPKEICKKCGKAREKILEKIGQPKYTEEGKPEGKNRSKMKWNDSHPSYNPRWWSDFKEMGYSDCKCGSGFSPGIVLDPFAGSCTTAVVARKLKRDWIMIEPNLDYINMARQRLRQKILI